MTEGSVFSDPNPEAIYRKVMSRVDHRVDDWLWMSSPVPTLILTVVYMVVVWLLPKYMQNRRPFELRAVISLYNAGLVVLSLYIFLQILISAVQSGYTFLCDSVDYSRKPLPMKIAAAVWWYYFSKCIEFMDTVFFILRKNYRQVTFLHVYHHATMFPIWWIGARFTPGGIAAVGPMLNSFVHTIMYAYYGLSALGPRVKKYLWWKRYLTILQLVQFVLAISHMVLSFSMECDFSKFLRVWYIAYVASHVLLFTNFYKKTYLSKGSKKEKDAQNGYNLNMDRTKME